MGDEKRWVVTPSGDHSLSDIRKSLVENGFRVDQVLTEIGLITGVAEDDVVAKVRNINGVLDVSPEQPVQLDPPDSPVTW